MAAYSDTFEEECVRLLAINVLKTAANDAKDRKDWIGLKHWLETASFDMWCSAARVNSRTIKQWFRDLWAENETN